jgi:ribonuclease HII
MKTKPTYEIEQELIDAGYLRVAGVDECARGTWWGSVVAAVVYIPPEKVPKLVDKVHDSKKLTYKKRNELSILIKDNCFYGIGEIGPDIIDEINILRATEQAMALALSKLQLDSGINYDYILIDGTVKLPMVNQPQKQVIKGDTKVLSIAAASIIAKTYRDNKILNLPDLDYYNLWDIGNNKGYGTKKHRDAIKEYGLSDLHRKTFGICKEFT